MSVVSRFVEQVDQVGGFSGPDVNWFALSPILVLVGAALTLLVVGALTPTWPRGLYAMVSAGAAAAAGVLAMLNWDDISDATKAGALPTTLVAGAVAFDTFAMFVTITICAALVGVVLVTSDHLRWSGTDAPELYALYLVAAAGGVVMASANDLVLLFLGLETLSLALYVLAASDRRRTGSQESGIKYFVLGGFSSAFFLYGVALVYGATGSTNLTEMVTGFETTVAVGGNDAFILAGVALLVVGLGFKVAAVPFHVWTPDVYQGAPSPVTGFMASVGKVAAFAALLRVFLAALPYFRDDWRPVIWVLAVLSVVVGSVLAVVQSNVKRMLAYSSISHAGFMLVGLEAAGHRAGTGDPGDGLPSVLVYLLTYAVIVVGTFGVVTLVSQTGDVTKGEGNTDLDSFRGLGRRHPALALGLTVFLLAQAGVPFTSGFIAKFGVISAAVDERSYALALIAMVASVIGAFLYLRIMVSAWMQDEEEEEEEESSRIPVASGVAIHGSDLDAAGAAVRGSALEAAGAASVRGRSSAQADATGSDVKSSRVPLASGVAIAAAAVFTLVVGIFPGWLLDVVQATTTFAR